MNEGIRVEQVTTCLLCESNGLPLYGGLQDRLFDAAGTWELLRCPRCGLVWLNPRPIAEDVGKVYAMYSTHTVEDPPPRPARLREVVKNSVLSATFGYDGLAGGSAQSLGRLLSWISPLRDMVDAGVMYLGGRQTGKLLDVGCGNGRFLAKMRDLGWEVFGVEPDVEAVKVAKERFNVEVASGRLEDVHFSESTFDAITLNHVIEHVPDPVALLQESRRVLKPGGKLVAVTPNVESLGHRLFRSAWLGLEPPRHFYLFSLRTLRTCAERAGLRVATLRSTARSARIVWSASRLIHRDGRLSGGLSWSLGWPLGLEGLAFQALEHGTCAFRNDIGEELVLVANRRESEGRC